MANSLQHAVHEHALILRELSENCRTHCYLCKQCFHGPTYCCLDCDVFLDKMCAFRELPLQIRHPSHPEHPINFDSTDCRYYCRGCKFNLSASAIDAVMTLPPEDKHKVVEDDAQHFAHEHPLSAFCLTTQSSSICRACRQHMAGSVYGCRQCMFLLHESCAKLPRKMHHPFHHQHPLTLVADFAVDFGDCYDCRVCSHRSRFMYRCDECRLNHCIKCIVSTLPPEGQEMEDSTQLEFFFHKHKLRPLWVEMENSILCQVCQLKISGEVYCCFDCIFFLHKACSVDLPQEVKHYLHKEHPLILRAAAPYNEGIFQCTSCTSGYNGMTFNCESCKFDLDPQCALQTLSAVTGGALPEIRHFSHPHPLTLVYSNEDLNLIDCDACNEPSCGLAYSCQECTFKFMLHKPCAELAQELEHQFHPPHPLILLSRAPAEYFYCNACHKKSEGFTFYCAECEFYLDLECVSRKPTLKHERHEHSLAYFPENYRLGNLHCNSCGMGCNRDLYRCVSCNFNLHHDCVPLPRSIDHQCHPYHPLILYDNFIDGRPECQYCDKCEEIRNPDHGVYRCAECWYTTHIECVIPIVEPEGPKPSENPILDELDKEIASLETKIEVLERNLKAAKGKLEELSEKRVFEYINRP
ncbi:uncharacterized protein LOC116190314 [Punica granatum]|uniref:Uncharacterized protein LOC116190314 n=2 Tax=Punica granatum TaxID=22663 RepID=A0A6P8BZT1_PUNGR|nr:uncharacterized protein LOC116190314 [Punica granatum]